MKLNFEKKILIFIISIMMIINGLNFTETDIFAQNEHDLISFLMTENENSPADVPQPSLPCPTGTKKGLPHLTPEEIDIPATYGSLLKGYTFIFGVDDSNKDYKVMDQFDSYEVALLVYKNITKSDKVGRIALDLREFGWKCGPKKVCELGNLFSNITSKDFDVNAFKTQVNGFFTKINGITKVCIGDTYTDVDDKVRGAVFCFNSQNDLTKFQSLFHYVSEKDIKVPSQTYDPETEHPFNIHFSDGHEILINKTLNFKVDGMYENEKLLMRYDTIEEMDTKKCNIVQNLPIVPIKFLDVKIYNSNCVAKFKYNHVDTYIGSNDKNCVNIMNYIITKWRNSCNNSVNGPMNKYKDETKNDQCKEGKWTGWVKYHKVMDNGGTVDPAPYKIVINPNATSIYNNMTAFVGVIAHTNITWFCNYDGECSIKDYLLYLTQTKQKQKLNDLTKVVSQINAKWNLQDYNHCFVIEEKDIVLICPIDLNEEVHVRKSLAIAVDKHLADAKSDLFYPDKNGTQYKVLFATDSSLYFEDHDITVLPDSVRDAT